MVIKLLKSSFKIVILIQHGNTNKSMYDKHYVIQNPKTGTVPRLFYLFIIITF